MLKHPTINIIGRGEEIEYNSGDKILYAERTFMNGSRFYPDLINKWNDGTKLTDEECKKVFNDIVDFLRKQEQKLIVVINRDDENMNQWNSLCDEKGLAIEWTSNSEIEKSNYESCLKFFERGQLMTEDRKLLKTRDEFEDWWLKRKNK